MTAHRLLLPADTCPDTGKRTYPTEDTAVRALEHKQRHGLPLARAYQCDGCGGWHLTGEGLPTQRRAR